MEEVKKETEKKEANTLGSRVFEIVQDEVHPDTNEQLMTLEQIKKGLAMRTIKQYAYIMHDKDIYTEKDLKKFKSNPKNEGKEPKWKVGDIKPKHWHIVFRTQRQTLVVDVAKWFNVPFQQVVIAKGQGAFLDKVQYLTHEKEKQQALGKKLYEDNEVTSNFDFRDELTKRDLRRAKFGKDLDAKTQMKYEVLYEGKTLEQCKCENELLYIDILDELKKLRKEYLLSQPTPTTRLNFYISGSGGVGKGLMSKALARSLYPQYTIDKEIFFEIGGENVTFEGYDGQPVIIWNDCRALELMSLLGGRGKVFDVFDTHPSSTQGRQHQKYGSIKLLNEVNIVNSVDDYITFLDGLAGQFITKDGKLIEAEDKSQSYRRFPMILPLHQDDFDILLNKGFMNDTNEFFEYIEYQHIRGNMQKIAIACANNEVLAREIERQTMALPTQKILELKEKNKLNKFTEEEIKDVFKDYGKQDTNLIEVTAEVAERINNHEDLEDKDGNFPTRVKLQNKCS